MVQYLLIPIITNIQFFFFNFCMFDLFKHVYRIFK